MKQETVIEVLGEIQSQLERWGVQDHPSVDPIISAWEGSYHAQRICEEYEIPTESRAKFLCEMANSRNELTWSHIAVEELSEVISAPDDATRRGELVQLAAVVLNWIDSIDRNAL